MVLSIFKKNSEKEFKKSQQKTFNHVRENYRAPSTVVDNHRAPGDKDIEELFDKYLRYQGIVGNDPKKAKMLALDHKSKWKIVQIHQHAIDEQEQSFKIGGTPEFFVHSLKENSSVENLQTLQKTLREKDEVWVEKVLGLNVLPAIFAVLVGCTENQTLDKLSEAGVVVDSSTQQQQQLENQKQTTIDEKTGVKLSSYENMRLREKYYNALQAECVSLIRALMNKKVGMEAFISSGESAAVMIARSLDSENAKTKSQVFLLLATVTVYSEAGFFMALDVVNQFKLLKREKARFETLASLLKKADISTEEHLTMLTTCLIFLNSLINSDDRATVGVLKKELKELGIPKAVSDLKVLENIGDKMTNQILAFEDEIDDADDEDFDYTELENMGNPLEILKLIRIQLSGTQGFLSFIEILQLFLVIAGKSTQAEKVENMRVLESIIKKTINSTTGSVEEISVRELQLTEKILAQQKAIEKLEYNQKKLSEMVKGGKVDAKTINAFLQTALAGDTVQELPKIGFQSQKIDDPDLKAKLEEIKNSDTAGNADVRTLEAEVKYLNYKLKQLQKKSEAASAAGSTFNNAASNASANSAGGAVVTAAGRGGDDGIGVLKGTGVGEVGDSDGSLLSSPPPPPPPSDGFGDGSNLPPPPPGVGGAGAMQQQLKLPVLPNLKSKVPMKGFFWSALPNKNLKNSVWIQNDLAATLGEVALNTEELETLFGAKQKSKEEGDARVQAQKVSFVDAKKAQNGAIILSAMKLSYEQICKAILHLDDEVLAQEQIKVLRDIAPTPEEITQIEEFLSKNGGGDLKDLGPVDQYYHVISKIPKYDKRLECWMFKNTFPIVFSSLSPDLDNCIEAINDLKSSKNLATFLQITLALGNFLNSGKKGAYGFTMSSLLKLKDLRATGSKITFLGYLVQFCEAKYPDLLPQLKKDLARLAAATKVSMQQVKTELSELKKGISLTLTEAEQASSSSHNDAFRGTMLEFSVDAETKYGSLEASLQTLEKMQKDLCQFFGEDEKKFQLSSFLTDLNSFLTDIDGVVFDLEKRREAEALRLERERKRELALKKKQNENLDLDEVTKDFDGSGSNTQESKKAEEDSGGLLDNLENELLDGTAFKRKNKKQKIRVDDLITKISSQENAIL